MEHGQVYSTAKGVRIHVTRTQYHNPRLLPQYFMTVRYVTEEVRRKLS